VERVNVAVTVLLADRVNEHAPVPEQAPLHPVKIDPVAGTSLQVTTVPVGYVLLTQLLPLRVPDPVPALETVRVSVVAALLKVAVTLLSDARSKLHVPVPVQAPLQPANVDPVAGVSVQVMAVPPG
jgi:hypothetical protein